MRSAPASTEEAKQAFLDNRREDIAAAIARDSLESLLVTYAHEMKKAGMYSHKTAIVDIASGLRKRVLRKRP
jgi:hypothetical protein